MLYKYVLMSCIKFYVGILALTQIEYLGIDIILALMSAIMRMFMT